MIPKSTKQIFHDFKRAMCELNWFGKITLFVPIGIFGLIVILVDLLIEKFIEQVPVMKKIDGDKIASTIHDVFCWLLGKIFLKWK